MDKKKSKYDFAFKKEAILELIDSGKKITELAEELGVDPALLRQWKHRYLSKDDESDKKGNTNPYELIIELKSEVKLLKLERDVLKHALVILSRDNDPNSNKGEI